MERVNSENPSTPSSIVEQRAFYDARWQRMTKANRLQLDRTIEILSALREANLTEPRILEVGCGTGWLTEILGRFGDATGVELSPLAVDKARVGFPDVQFHAVDLSRAGDIGRFDLVVSHEVIEHLEDQAAHINLVADALNPGGVLILTTPNGRFRGTLRQEDGPQPIENWLSKHELRRLAAARLTVLECRSICQPRGATKFDGLLLSSKLRRLLGTVHLRPAYERLLKRAGYGRHLLLVARQDRDGIDAQSKAGRHQQ